MGKPVVLTDQNFKNEVLESKVPVLVDFWAEWCGPCKQIAPIVEEIAQSYDSKIKVGKVDVDANNQTALNYMIRSIPSLLFFKNGKVVEQVIGAVPRQQLLNKVEAVLK